MYGMDITVWGWAQSPHLERASVFRLVEYMESVSGVEDNTRNRTFVPRADHDCCDLGV